MIVDLRSGRDDVTAVSTNIDSGFAPFPFDTLSILDLRCRSLEIQVPSAGRGVDDRTVGKRTEFVGHERKIGDSRLAVLFVQIDDDQSG